MLNMPGPQFLLFFAVLSFIVILAVNHAIARAEASLTSNTRLRDPYDIAYLRGGLTELVRVAALALTLRRRLIVDTDPYRLVVTDKAIFNSGPAIEREVLLACRRPLKPARIAHEPGVKAAAELHRVRLLGQGLLTDAAVRGLRWPPVLAGFLVLLGLATAKIHVALSTGHRNIGLLIVLCFIVCVILLSRAVRRRTRAGDEALSNLRTLFASLKHRRSSLPVGAESDATMLAAVFGGVAGSGIDRATWRRMFNQEGSSSSGCGSSCGGGGGCGGGGCGGCGS